jgi:hypothetical protein
MKQIREWMTIKKVAERTGYSDQAIRTKCQSAVWTKGLMWRNAPDGRLLIDLQAVYRWIEESPVKRGKTTPIETRTASE